MPMLFSKHENRMSPAQVRLGAGSVVHHSKSDRSMSVQGHEPPRRSMAAVTGFHRRIQLVSATPSNLAG